MVERKLHFYDGENAKLCKKFLKLNNNSPRWRVCDKSPAVTFPQKFSFNYLPFVQKNWCKICSNLVGCKYFTKMFHPMPMNCYLFLFKSKAKLNIYFFRKSFRG
jgi:hypothetical protein